jgi:RNase P subunit RPR2
MKRKAASQSSWEDQAAGRRIETLLSLAKDSYFAGEQKLAKRYVLLARKIAMRHRLKIGVASFCKRCNQVFCEQGKTHKMRVIEGRAYRVCGSCNEKRLAGKAAAGEKRP